MSSGQKVGKANALVGETSPYLLQHAYNPVEWRAWGAEAFEVARREGRPIFLSIGYSTCYWCHVMERQCFENPRIAELMNREFVCIKVDREERPDVDEIYMAAVQMMSGQGGWPMSVFLTPPGSGGEKDPGLKPFFAGTYFPPGDGYGRPGFPRVLEALAGAWKEKRGEVLEQAEQVAGAVREHLSRDPGSAPGAEEGGLSAEMVRGAANQLFRVYDREHGGFGGAPKFPQASTLGFLIGLWRNNPQGALGEAIGHTLVRMASGGMYDQIGGGFHRYSTDEKWLVPHFEKMLYDQGQMVEVYCSALGIRHPASAPGSGPGPGSTPGSAPRGAPGVHANAEMFRRVVRETCECVLREMVDETGAFWSAQDAEVEAREGENYVWTPEEVRAAVGKELGELAVVMYGLDRGTNFRDPHHEDAEAVNVLYLPVGLEELAGARGMTVEELMKKKGEIDRRMMAVRGKRKQPGTDDKVIVSWNGMMIGGMAMAGRELGVARFVQAASRAAMYILENMRVGGAAAGSRHPASADGEGQVRSGGLYRTMRKGIVKTRAFLEDYAFFVHGLVELYRGDRDERWLRAAEELVGVVNRDFGSEGGGYFDTLAGQADLFVRVRSSYDGAIPSGNSQMVHDLLDLFELTGKGEYLERAVLDLRSFAGALGERGANMTHMELALLRVLEVSPERVGGRAGKKKDVASEVTVGASSGVVEVGGEVVVRLKIAEGYHVNANRVSEEGLVGTEVRLVDGEGLAVDVKYPEGEVVKFEFADRGIKVYRREVDLVVRVRRVGEVKKKQTAGLVVRYQACTETECLAVREVEVPVKILVKE